MNETSKPLARTAIVNQAKDAARHPYAWPGGYEKFAIMADGGVVCPACLKKEWRQVCHDTLVTGWQRTGWCVAAVDAVCNVDGPLACDHCNRELLEEPL